MTRQTKPTQHIFVRRAYHHCEAGVPPLVISRVMRHSAWVTTPKHHAPGNVECDAEELIATRSTSLTIHRWPPIASKTSPSRTPPRYTPIHPDTPRYIRGANSRKSVRPGGLEPPTDGLEIRCSIRLSYGRGSPGGGERMRSLSGRACQTNPTPGCGGIRTPRPGRRR
jgi:hypothetical protein